MKKTSFKLRFFLCVMSIGCATDKVFASEEPVRTETVVVTASRPAADEFDTHFQTSTVRVVNVAESGKNMATVADVLNREASVQVRQLAGLGSYSAVSIRGSSSDQVNVYLDGVLLNDAYGGSVDLSQFLLNNVESIEIFRGGVPVQLGAAGIGGAINIKTKRLNGETGGLYELGYGSFNSQKASARFAGQEGKHDYQAALSYLTSDNDYEFLNDAQTPDNPTDDRTERRRNAGVEQFSGLFTVNTELEGNRHFKTVLQHEQKDKHTPNIANDPLNNATYDTKFSSLKGSLNETLDESSSVSYQVSVSRKTSQYKDLDGRVGIARNNERAVLNHYAAQFDFSQSLGMHVVNVHGELDLQDYKLRDFILDTRREVERQRVRLAVQDEWVNKRGDLLLVARAAYEANNDSDKLADNADQDNQYLDAHVGARYWFKPQWSLSANVSRDIRTPKLNELYGDQGNSAGNDDLTEEYALNADLGLSYESNRVSVRTQLFLRDLKDAIIIDYDSQGTGKPKNIAEAQIRGFELEADFSLGNGFTLRSNYTGQESENLSGQKVSRGEPLPGIYEHAFSSVLSFSYNFYRAELEYSHNSGGFFDAAGVFEKPEINQFSLLNEWTFGTHKIALRAENLTDEPVQYFNRFAGPGRRFFLTYASQF